MDDDNESDRGYLFCVRLLLALLTCYADGRLRDVGRET